MERLSHVFTYICESPTTGIFLAVISSIFLSLAHFMVQIANSISIDIPGLQVVLVRCTEQLIIFTPFLLLYRGRMMRPSTNTWVALLLLSVAGYAGYILLYYALDKIPFSIVITLSAACPLFAALFSVVILKELLHCTDILCGILSLIGVIAIARPWEIAQRPTVHESHHHHIPKGKLHFIAGCCLALLYGVSQALYLVLVRKWKSDVSHILTLCGPSALGCFVTPVLMVMSEKRFIIPKDTYGLFSLFSVGLLTSVGICTQVYALKFQTATIVGVIRNLEIVWAFLLQYMALCYTIYWWNIAGAAIIVVSSILSAFTSDALPSFCGGDNRDNAREDCVMEEMDRK